MGQCKKGGDLAKISSFSSQNRQQSWGGWRRSHIWMEQSHAAFAAGCLQGSVNQPGQAAWGRAGMQSSERGTKDGEVLGSGPRLSGGHLVSCGNPLHLSACSCSQRHACQLGPSFKYHLFCVSPSTPAK